MSPATVSRVEQRSGRDSPDIAARNSVPQRLSVLDGGEHVVRASGGSGKDSVKRMAPAAQSRTGRQMTVASLACLGAVTASATSRARRRVRRDHGDEHCRE